MKLSTTFHALSGQQLRQPEPLSRLSRTSVLARLRQMTKERVIADADEIAQRFPRGDRSAMRRFVVTSSAQADVAQQFPMLAFMLATRRVPARQREDAGCAIASGAPLQKVAAIVGVPMWTRLIPPASCVQPSVCLPNSAKFACQIRDVLKRRIDDDADLRRWLCAVAQVHDAAGEEFALWLAARYPDGTAGDLPAGPLRTLVLWYLASKTARGQVRDMIHTCWRRDLSLETAVRAARNFARRIDLELLVGPRGVQDTWFPQDRVCDLDFLPLVNSTGIRDEALRNENCLDTYGQRLAKNELRLYSVRNREGRCVANVEISPTETFPIRPFMAQIKAPKNDPVAPFVNDIAEIWLQRQLAMHGVPDMRRSKLPTPDAQRWSWLIAPLKEAGQLPSWAERCPTSEELERTELEFSILGYRLHARGWRFA
jgi:hypothetical protein